MNITDDSTRYIRYTRISLLSILFLVGLTGCCIVIYWLIRYARWNVRSGRICSLILNLILADLSVNIFATGVQIFWEFQTDRQWPFNDFLCRLTKFLQSFSILSSTYLVVVMAIDRCIAITSPLRVAKIRVFYLCGSAWLLSALLSTPNVFIFRLEINGTSRHCSSNLHQFPTRTRQRIFLTFISLVVYFIPFAILVICYTKIFIKLLWRENGEENGKIGRSCFSWLFLNIFVGGGLRRFRSDSMNRSASTRSSFSEFDARRKRANTYAKARTKTFRLIIVLVLVMIIFGAPYYCMELYVAYTERTPLFIVSGLAGGAAVAPSSLDPWIFLLFWTNWHQPVKTGNSRRMLPASAPIKHQQYIQVRRIHHSNTVPTSSSSDHRQRFTYVLNGNSRQIPYVIRWNAATKKQQESA